MIKKSAQNFYGRILIADDIEENLVYLNKILTFNGYTVIMARSGDEAWPLFRQFMPEIALLDVRMPGLDGYALCRMIKSDPELKDIPVMFISAYYESMDKIAGFEAGGVDYINKPIDPNELLSRVNTHLNLGRIRTQLAGQADELNTANARLMQQVEAYKIAQEEIRSLNESLEQRVLQRTQQLVSANQELEAFSYSVSHDLRAPLRAIDGFTRILLEDYEPQLDTEGKRICSVIRENAQRMGQLIDDLLTFSRLGRSVMRTVAVDMNSLISEVLDEIVKTRTISDIEFLIAPLEGAPGDPAMLKQVWFNLIDNAVKFTSRSAHPVISIRSWMQDGRIVFAISDNGAGFDMDYADKIFGVFQRLHPIREYDGTGVGLAIVERIVKRHGGRVWAEGTPNQGATFYFNLPSDSTLDDPLP